MDQILENEVTMEATENAVSVGGKIAKAAIVVAAGALLVKGIRKFVIAPIKKKRNAKKATEEAEQKDVALEEENIEYDLSV